MIPAIFLSHLLTSSYLFLLLFLIPSSIRLKPGHTLADMKLPPLPANHRYAAPAGSLTRAGQFLFSHPLFAYSFTLIFQETLFCLDSDLCLCVTRSSHLLVFTGTLSAPPPYSIAPPTEPSSHSSSVAAQPNANFHAHKYRDYSGGWRVVKAQNGTTGVTNATPKNNRRSSGPTQIALNATSSNNNPLGIGSSSGAGGGGRAAAALAAEKRINSAGQRRMSASNINSSSGKDLVDQRPSNRHVSSSSNQIKTVGGGGNRPVSAGANGILSSSEINGFGSNPNSPNLQQSSTFQNNQTTTPSQIQSPQFSTSSQSPQQSSQSPTQPSSSTNVGPSMASSMPLTALVIGPGVQGQVGRNASSAAAPMGTHGAAKVMGGNANAFVGFTSASGEIQPRSKPKRKGSRNKSEDFPLGGGMGKEAAMNAFPPIFNNNTSPVNASNAAADAAERRIAAEKARKLEEEESQQTSKRERHVSAGALLNSSNHRPETFSRTQTGNSTTTTTTTTTATGTSTSNSSNKIELPPIQSLPPIQNLAPFPNPEDEEREIRERLNLGQRENGLPPMPTAVGAPIVSEHNGSGRPGLHSREDSRGSRNEAEEEGDVTVGPITTSNATGRNRKESNGNGNLNSNPRNGFKNSDRKFSSSSNHLERMLLERKPSQLSQDSSNPLNSNGNQNNGGSRISNGLNFFRRESSNRGKSGTSTPNHQIEEDQQIYNLSENDSNNDFKVDIIATSSNSKGKEKEKEEVKLSKADKRYQEVQKTLAKERQKQSAAEEARKEEYRLKEAKKAEERKKKELEEKQKKVEEQWKVWEEVRRREKELGLAPPKVEDRI